MARKHGRLTAYPTDCVCWDGWCAMHRPSFVRPHRGTATPPGRFALPTALPSRPLCPPDTSCCLQPIRHCPAAALPIRFLPPPPAAASSPSDIAPLLLCPSDFCRRHQLLPPAHRTLPPAALPVRFFFAPSALCARQILPARFCPPDFARQILPARFCPPDFARQILPAATLPARLPQAPDCLTASGIRLAGWPTA